MTIDIYSLCPSGNGKKIKFCKCKDLVHEMDRITKMIEGKQKVAALDRLRQVLDQHPSAACFLAIRCDLLRSLGETQPLQESAERFVRLQPANPLALGFKASAVAANGNALQGIETLLRGFDESGPSKPAKLFEVAAELAFHAVREDWMQTAVFLLELVVSQVQDCPENLVDLLIEITQASSLNLYLKESHHDLSRPSGVDWGERFDEARGLIADMRILTAQTKLESLERQYPQEPPILIALYYCAIWRADVNAQRLLLQRLSRCEGLDFDRRAKYLSLFCLLDRDSSVVSIPRYRQVYGVDDYHRFYEQLVADERFQIVPETSYRDVLARLGYVNDQPPGFVAELTTGLMPPKDQPFSPDQVPSLLAVLVGYAKQTDREARVDVLYFEHAEGQWNTVVEPLFGEKQPIRSDTERINFYRLLSSRPNMSELSDGESVVNLELRLLGINFLAHVDNLKLDLFDRKPIDSIRDDDDYLLQRTALARMLRREDMFMATIDYDNDLVVRLLNVPAEQPLVLEQDFSSDSLDSLRTELPRVDVSEMDCTALNRLLMYVNRLRSGELISRISQRLRAWTGERDESFRKGATSAHYLSVTHLYTPSTLTLVNEIVQDIQEGNFLTEPDAGRERVTMIVTILKFLLRTGRYANFFSILEGFAKQFRDDQYVQMGIHDLLVQLGIMNPDGSMNKKFSTPQTEPASSSGIWTPDQAESPVDSATTPEAGKLWLPGDA